GLSHASIPVLPGAPGELPLGGGVAWQERQLDRPAAGGVILRPGTHRLRRPGEAVAQEQSPARVRVTPRAPGVGQFTEGHGSIVASAPARFIPDRARPSPDPGVL